MSTFSLCDHCHEQEAVCKWSLYGEHYGDNLCSDCCNRLSNVYNREGYAKRKLKFVRHVSEGNLTVLVVVVMMFLIKMRDPNIDYMAIFEYDTICSLTLVALASHLFSKMLRSISCNRIFYSLSVILYELFGVVTGVYVVFSDPYVFNCKEGVMFLVGAGIALMSIVVSKVLERKVLQGKKISIWVFTGITIFGMMAIMIPSIVWQ